MNATDHRELLDRLVASGAIDASHASSLGAQTTTPWWLALLQGVAAWIASLILVASFFSPLIFVTDHPVARTIGGALLIAMALWLFRRRHPFFAQMALALSLAGQALVVVSFAETLDDPGRLFRWPAVIALTLAAAMLVPTTTTLHRTVCALIITISLGVMIGPGNGLTLYAALLTITAVIGWVTRSRWAAGVAAARAKPLLHAFTLAALVAAWLVSVETTRALMIAGSAASEPHWPALYPTAVGATLLVLVAWLTREGGFALRAATLAASGTFVLAAWQAPGLITSAAILLAAFHACHRAWSMLALIAAVFYLGELYYSLHVSLLAKSATLAASGLVLLALWLALRRWPERLQ